MRMPATSLLLVLLSVGDVVFSADETPPSTLDLYPTIEAIGLTLSAPPPGAISAMERQALVCDWRVEGDNQWHFGPMLLPNQVNDKLRCSIFPLPAGKKIEVRVIDDAGTVYARGAVALRPDRPDFGKPTKIIHVSPTGNDTSDGTPAMPLKTLNRAIKLAAPGTEIVLHEGQYDEGVVISKSGAPGAYITIRAVEGESVVITGKRMLNEASMWRAEGPLLFSVEAAKTAVGTREGGVRIYCYNSAAGLKQSYNEGQSRIDKAIAVREYERLTYAMANVDGARMLFRIPAGRKPDELAIAIAQRDTAVTFNGASYVRLTGLQFEYASWRTIRFIKDSHDNVIDHCRFTCGGDSIKIEETAHDNLIEHNTFTETADPAWEWQHLKSSLHEVSAISNRGGSGNVLRHNTCDGMFNGVIVYTDMGSADETRIQNTDVYGNVIRNNLDDGLELEGSCVNIRVWNNQVSGDTHSAISVAPINVGPLYVYRNAFVLNARKEAKTYKGRSGPTAGYVLFYHNTSYALPGSADTDGIKHENKEGPVDRMVWRNNVMMCSRYVIEFYAADRCDYDHNVFFSTSADQFIKTNDKGRFENLAELEKQTGKRPRFTHRKVSLSQNASAEWITLDPLVIDAGVIIRGFNDVGFKGKAPDMGYVEVQ
jgi:hypothetical protein